MVGNGGKQWQRKIRTIFDIKLSLNFISKDGQGCMVLFSYRRFEGQGGNLEAKKLELFGKIDDFISL